MSRMLSMCPGQSPCYGRVAQPWHPVLTSARTPGRTKTRGRPGVLPDGPGTSREAEEDLRLRGDLDLDLGRHIAVQTQLHLVLTGGLDGLGQVQMAAVHRLALGGERLGDVQHGDGAVELVLLTHLAADGDLHGAELLGLLLGNALEL